MFCIPIAAVSPLRSETLAMGYKESAPRSYDYFGFEGEFFKLTTLGLTPASEEI